MISDCQKKFLDFQLYQIPIFTEEFCDLFCDELANFNAQPDLPKERPNTMNRFGVILIDFKLIFNQKFQNFQVLLDEIGFLDFFNEFRVDFVQPIAARLFPEWSDGVSGLDSHRAFTVKYSPDTDQDLGFHYDNAEVSVEIWNWAHTWQNRTYRNHFGGERRRGEGRLKERKKQVPLNLRPEGNQIPIRIR